MTSSNAGAGPSVEQQICYAMHTTVRAFDAVYRDLLGEHGLSYPQYIALMAVGEHGPLTVGALGEVLRLDSGTLSPLLKRMAAAGLVDRTARPGGRETRARGPHGSGACTAQGRRGRPSHDRRTQRSEPRPARGAEEHARPADDDARDGQPALTRQEGSRIDTAWMSMPMSPPTRVPLMRMNCRSRPTWSSTRSAVSLPSHRSTVWLITLVSSAP